MRSEQCNPDSPIISRYNFEIIGYVKDRYLLQLKESILIRRHNPKINVYLDGSDGGKNADVVILNI